MARYYLSLGSNMGNRDIQLERGIEELRNTGTVLRVSSFYETKAWGSERQPDFLNAAVEFESGISPEELLDAIKKIEKKAGRDFSAERWSPRPIDIDILLCGDLVLSTPRLCIPHPYLSQREFVLAPLAEIAPDVAVPGTGKPVGSLWAEWKADHPSGPLRVRASV